VFLRYIILVSQGKKKGVYWYPTTPLAGPECNNSELLSIYYLFFAIQTNEPVWNKWAVEKRPLLCQNHLTRVLLPAPCLEHKPHQDIFNLILIQCLQLVQGDFVNSLSSTHNTRYKWPVDNSTNSEQKHELDYSLLKCIYTFLWAMSFLADLFNQLSDCFLLEKTITSWINHLNWKIRMKNYCKL